MRWPARLTRRRVGSVRAVASVATVEAPVATTLARRTAGLLVACGLAVWAAVTATVRLVGHRLLAPGSPAVVAALFVVTAPLMALVTYPVYRRSGVEPARRPPAAVAMSLPGTFLDVLLVAFARTALPDRSTGAVVNLGTILLFGYAVVLLTVVVRGSDGRGRPVGPTRVDASARVRPTVAPVTASMRYVRPTIHPCA